VKILALGGTRFFGAFVVDELLGRGHDVGVLGMDCDSFARPVMHLGGDAPEGEALRRAIASWRPEVVLDMAHTSPAHAESVVTECAGKVKRSVHLSSAAVYGEAPVCPVDEDTEVAAHPPPEVALQIEADRVALDAAKSERLAAVLVRLPELYGPRDSRCAAWFFARRVLDGRTRIAVPDGGLNICHRGFVQNMAWGVGQALCLARVSGTYNLGEEKLYTVAQLARGVARALDYDWDIYSVPGRLWRTPYAHTSFFDLRRARAQLRYRDRMIPRDGLELTLAWLCQNPRGDDWSWPGIERPFEYAQEDAVIEEHGVKLDA
jgi:nucleoside-diphosphate-sugar epimerase